MDRVLPITTTHTIPVPSVVVKAGYRRAEQAPADDRAGGLLLGPSAAATSVLAPGAGEDDP
jgi:hypothetical protein